MCVEAQFLKGNRVILYKYSDPLDLAKAVTILSQHRQFYTQSHQPIHRIVDARRVTKVPDGLFSAVLHNTNLRQPNSGVTVAVVNQPLLRILAEMLKTTLRSADVRVVSTMDEALAEIDRILAQEDQIVEVAGV